MTDLYSEYYKAYSSPYLTCLWCQIESFFHYCPRLWTLWALWLVQQNWNRIQLPYTHCLLLSTAACRGMIFWAHFIKYIGCLHWLGICWTSQWLDVLTEALYEKPTQRPSQENLYMKSRDSKQEYSWSLWHPKAVFPQLVSLIRSVPKLHFLWCRGDFFHSGRFHVILFI